MRTKDEGYYEIDEELLNSLIELGCVDDVFYIKDLQQRKLFFNDVISQDTVQPIVKHILQFNKEDRDKPAEERQPILLYITSDGGCVDSGFQLIDAISNSVTPVYTINLGWCYSMALIVYLAGHKRYCMRNAKFLMHDGASFIANSSLKAADQMKFQRDMDLITEQFIISRTNLTEEKYKEMERVEWYMFAQEAKEYGLVDYIIGEDCDLNAII